MLVGPEQVARARKIADRYARDVLAGKIVAGRYIHLACQRWFDDWESRERKGFVWSDERADHVLEMASLCRHYQGRWAKGADRDGTPCAHGDGCRECRYPQRWDVQPWQVFQLANVFGWTVQRHGVWARRFTKVYDEEARKNGKSYKVGFVGFYLGFLDGEEGAEIYSAATKYEQAKKCWAAAYQIVKATPEFEHLAIECRGNWKIQRSTLTMYSDETSSKFSPIGAESETEDGANVHGALIDEYHAHKDDGLVGVLETAIGARDEPLMWIITTAGESVESPCGYERGYAIQVLTGAVEDESYFATIYELDEADEEAGIKGDDWEDESVWRKANPNLDVSVHTDVLRDNVKRAKGNPLKLAEVQRKHFNLWRNNPRKGWITLAKWDRCKGARPEGQLKGLECFGGLDLAANNDTCARALLFPPQDGLKVWAVRVKIFIPEATMRERQARERQRYQVWADQGLVEITEGEVTDYDVIERDLVECSRRYNLGRVGFDPHFANQLVTRLMDEHGIDVLSLKQGFPIMSEPMLEFEREVLARQVDHGKNPVLRYHVDNVAVRKDDQGRVMPSKRLSVGRIDAVVAVLLARRAATMAPAKSRYEDDDAELIVA